MVQSAAATPDDYLRELEPARRVELSAVRDLVNGALAPGFVERMAWGMISWEVPVEVSGPTYNKQPLSYVALAAQKRHLSLYLNCVGVSDERTERLRKAFAAAGKKFDMGKGCLRFRAAADLPAEALAAEIGSLTPAEFVDLYRKARGLA